MSLRAHFVITSAGAVIIAASAGNAGAQIAPGRSGTSSMRYFSGEEAWRELASFGKCYASRNREKALKLIETEPGSKAEIEAYAAMFRSQNQSCLGAVTQLSMDHAMVRGAIAEGLYRQRDTLSANLSMVPLGKDEQVSTLTGVARCYVAEHRSEVHNLIVTTWPGSKEEQAEIKRMIPDLAKCVPAGAKLDLSATRVRYRFAEVLYRMKMPVSQLAGAN